MPDDDEDGLDPSGDGSEFEPTDEAADALDDADARDELEEEAERIEREAARQVLSEATEVERLNAMSDEDFAKYIALQDEFKSLGSPEAPVEPAGEMSTAEADALIAGELTEEQLQAEFAKTKAEQQVAEFTQFARDRLEAQGFDALNRKWRAPEPEGEPDEDVGAAINVFERMTEAEFDQFLKARDAGQIMVGVGQEGVISAFNQYQKPEDES